MIKEIVHTKRSNSTDRLATMVQSLNPGDKLWVYFKSAEDEPDVEIERLQHCFLFDHTKVSDNLRYGNSYALDSWAQMVADIDTKCQES